MYAIIQVGPYQYKVQEGSKIEIDHIDGEKGKEVPIDQVLAFAKDEDVRVGQPFLKDIKVTAQVLAQIRDVKKIAFKYRKRKDSATTHGHRQNLTILAIKSIKA